MAKNIAKAAKGSLGQVRIIGGDYRRRLINFIDADGLRPTPDRLRETLFNWLSPHLPNALVLDCCAGSGVLGFEAISRGAAHVSFIEANRLQYQQLITTANLLAIPVRKYKIYHGFAQQILPALEKTQNFPSLDTPSLDTHSLAVTDQPVTMSETSPFDVVLLDPPYTANLWLPLLQQLQTTHLVRSGSLIYIEANQPVSELGIAEVAWLQPVKNTKVGQIVAGLWQVIDP